MLLHYGGLDLQDVFYTLPSADTVGKSIPKSSGRSFNAFQAEVKYGIREACISTVETKRRRGNEPVRY